MKEILIKYDVIPPILAFTGKDYLIPPGGRASIVAPVVYITDAVSGGKAPYTFEVISMGDGRNWLKTIGGDSYLTGTRPGINCPSTTADIKVTDALGNSIIFTVYVGAVGDLPDITEINSFTKAFTDTALVGLSRGLQTGDVLLIAYYNGVGKLLHFQIITYTDAPGPGIFIYPPAGTPAGTRIKAMLWEGLDTMKPLCIPKELLWN